jgi:hypothetical protein
MHMRSRRLQDLLGVPLRQATYQHFVDLVGMDEAREAEDLDYKVTYADKPKAATVDKVGKANRSKADDIAVDVATFANHRGGVVVIGVSDTQGIPSAAPGIDLTDQFEREVRTAIAARIHPRPVYDLKRLPQDPGSSEVPRRGILLLGVPESPNKPHAVSDPGQEGVLRYPLRYGSQKIWMSESQVAAAYRSRYTTAVDSRQRIAEVESDILLRVATSTKHRSVPRPLLMVSLAPETPGNFVITTQELVRFRADLQADPFLPERSSALFGSAGVSQGRVHATGRINNGDAWTELHTDGAGSIVFPLQCIIGDPDTVGVPDAPMTQLLLFALRFLSRHTANRAGAMGTAVVTARLLPDVRAFNATDRRLIQAIDRQLGQGSQAAQPYNPDVAVRPVTGGGTWVGQQAAREGYGQSVAFLDDLIIDRQPLAAVAGHLAGLIMQAYGLAQSRQIQPDGTLELAGWDLGAPAMRTWAQEAGIPIVEGGVHR